MDKWLKLFKMPWSADLKFTISEELLEALIKEAVGEKVKIKEVRCHDGYVSITIKTLMTIMLDLAIDSIRLSKDEIILTIKDVRGNISSFKYLIDQKKHNLRFDKDGIIEIDLTKQIVGKISNVPIGVADILNYINISLVLLEKELRLSITSNSG